MCDWLIAEALIVLVKNVLDYNCIVTILSIFEVELMSYLTIMVAIFMRIFYLIVAHWGMRLQNLFIFFFFWYGCTSYRSWTQKICHRRLLSILILCKVQSVWRALLSTDNILLWRFRLIGLRKGASLNCLLRLI